MMSTMRLARRPDESPGENQWTERASGDAKPQIDLQEAVKVLSRRKKLIISTIILVMLFAHVVVSSLTPRYTASAFVEINPRQARVVDFESVLAGLPADDETIQTEIEIIQSRVIALRAIEHLDLKRDPEFNLALRPLGLIQSWRASLANWLVEDIEAPAEGLPGTSEQEADESTGALDRIKLTLAGYLAPVTDELTTEDGARNSEMDRVVDVFRSSLSVQPERRSRILRISFESENPRTAAAAADAIADFYIVAQLEAKFEATKRATTWLNERVLQLRSEVVSKERVIEEYRAKSGLLQGGTDATLASQEISELNAQHVLEVARLAEARARLRQANKLLELPGGIESSVEVLESDLIRELRTEEALLEREIAELAEDYGERHPSLIKARAELQDLRTKIELEVNRVIEGLRNEVAVAAARASSLALSLERNKEQMALLNQSEVELRALELDANASRTLLENLLERTKQTASQESFQQADANIISSAVLPRTPSFPRKGLVLSLSLIFGITLGVLLALAIEHLDFGLRSGEQASRILGVKSLALLPRVSKISATGKSPHDYVLSHPDSAYGEGIRTLFTNLLLTDVARRPKVIMMTSALPNEGKTTVTLSLARLLAMMDYSVVVVDCDLRNPTVHKRLGIEPGPGLLDCLSSGTAVEEVIQRDKASGAHVLRAGNSAGGSLAQFDPDVMQRLLRQLSRKYNIVLLDSAPVLAVSDSLFLAGLADKTVFLIRWAKTRQAAAKLGLEQALAAHGDIAGVALTLVDTKSHATYGFGDSGVYHGRFKKYYTGS